MKITQELLDSPIQEYLDVRLCNALEKGNVRTMYDLFMCCGRDTPCELCSQEPCCDRTKLLAIKQFGTASLEKVYRRLEELGIIQKREGATVPENSRSLRRLSDGCSKDAKRCKERSTTAVL